MSRGIFCAKVEFLLIWIGFIDRLS